MEICLRAHVFCWVLFGSSKALRAPELKVIESEPVIWILLPGYFICMWERAIPSPPVLSPSSGAIPLLQCFPFDFLPKLIK